ncbi:hypothetical protein M3Y96_01090300 [Aphelenchoides besseyi]|nr:hypothetical protein M3Y96_01090300 [Aphelenchoides besseyi]
MNAMVLLRFLTIFIVIAQTWLHINALTHQKALRSRQLGTEAQIINRIFNDYNPYIRPPVRDYADHGAIVVITSIHINRIQWHTHVAEIDLYLRQQWEDTRLAYDVDVREGISEIAIPQNRKVWTPDTYFGTANEKPIDDTRRNRIVVEPTGDVRASEQRLVEVGVDNSIAFPFHNQKSFRLRLASYNYPIEDVVYLWANSPPRIVPVETSQELLHGNTYTLTDAYVGDCVGNYTVGVYSCIDVLVTFRGPATAPIFQLFCPSIFLVWQLVGSKNILSGNSVSRIHSTDHLLSATQSHTDRCWSHASLVDWLSVPHIRLFT